MKTFTKILTAAAATALLATGCVNEDPAYIRTTSRALRPIPMPKAT